MVVKVVLRIRALLGELFSIARHRFICWSKINMFEEIDVDNRWEQGVLFVYGISIF